MGDIQTCENYKGNKLMSHTMNLWERIYLLYGKELVLFFIDGRVMDKYQMNQK